MSIAVNIVVIAGNLTRDVDYRNTNSGKSLCTFGVAVNEGTKDKPQVSFIDVTCWEKTADLCRQYICKGSAVLIEGCLRTESWEDKQTGQKRSKLGVIARRVQFLSNRPQEQQVASQPPKNANNGYVVDPKYAPPEMPDLQTYDPPEIDGEIPF